MAKKKNLLFLTKKKIGSYYLDLSYLFLLSFRINFSPNLIATKSLGTIQCLINGIGAKLLANILKLAPEVRT